MKYFIMIFIFLSGCAGIKTRNSATSSPVSSNSEIKKNLKLAKMKTSVGNKNHSQVSKEDQLFFELSGIDYNRMTEDQILKKIKEFHLGADLRAMEPMIRLLTVKYPHSDRVDNALLSAGNLAFSEKKYALALEYYNRIIRDYPLSNKTVSAVYAKGQVYKRLNLPMQSLYQYDEVVKKYPGSPEAERVNLERSIVR